MKKSVLAVLLVLTPFLLTACAGGNVPAADSATEVTAAATTSAATQAPTDLPTTPPVTQQTTQPTESSTQAASLNPMLEQVAGSWTMAYYQYEDGSTQPAKNKVQYIFSADSTFTALVSGNVATGTFDFDGSTLSYKADANGESGEFIYDSNNDYLYEDGQDGAKAILTRD